jgi:hypothetical protein
MIFTPACSRRSADAPEAESENKEFGQQLDSNCVMANSQLVTWKSPCFQMGIQQQGLGFGMGVAFRRHWLKIHEKVTLNRTLDRSDPRRDYTHQL